MKALEHPLKTTEIFGEYKTIKDEVYNVCRGFLWGTAFRTTPKRRLLMKYQDYNKNIMSKITDRLYLKLKENYEKLDSNTLVIRYTLQYNPEGKVIGIKDLDTRIFLKIGQLNADNYTVKMDMEKIDIHFFYSKDDARTFAILKHLENIKSELPSDILKINEIDWDSLTGRQTGNIYKITQVPTIQIEDKQLIDPSEYQLRNTIMKSFTSNVEVSNEKLIT